MIAHEILQHIDNAANHYLQVLGMAEHMETINNGFYTVIRPKAGEGIHFAFNLRLSGLSPELVQEKVQELKSLHIPVWFPLLGSEDIMNLFFGREKTPPPGPEDEVYMAMYSREMPVYPAPGEGVKIIKVTTPEEFSLWAKLNNDLLSEGRTDIHPVYHYPLCRQGLMRCFLLFEDGVLASVAAVMEESGVLSLELVATVPEKRRRGLARQVCQAALMDSVSETTKLLTVRAVDSVAAKLYASIGFKAYN